MLRFRTAHTSELASDELSSIRRLLDAAFDGDFDEADRDHTIGGMHGIAYDGVDLVGHVSVVQRRLLHAGRALRVGYLEALAVRADRRRQGVSGRLMAEAERVIAGAYELGALSDGSGVETFYERRGWLVWRGPTATLAPGGVRPTPDDDGGVLVLPTPATPAHDLDGELVCDWRPGDVW